MNLEPHTAAIVTRYRVIDPHGTVIEEGAMEPAGAGGWRCTLATRIPDDAEYRVEVTSYRTDGSPVYPGGGVAERVTYDLWTIY